MKPSCKCVLYVLRAADSGWVRGVDLAEVGGFRFGGRIHELRHDFGYRIERRSDPRSAVDQYRLLPPEKPEQLSLTLERVAS